MRSTLATLVLSSLALAAAAAPPNACTVVTAQDISAFSERPVEKHRVQKAGNPSECGFMDSRGGVVLVVSLKEVQYAAKDELEVERTNLEKIYRVKAKEVDTVGDAAYWMPGNKSMWFRKGKIIGSVAFQTPKNQNEIDSGQMARLVEARLK